MATITLHRPERMNAFTDVMMREVIDAFDQVDADDDVRVVIVTGSGDRAFCAGADLGGGGETFAKGGSDIQTSVGVPRDGGGMVSLRIFDCKKPVIGAINGAAVGVGVTMTLPMDVRLASDNARFGFVFARRGIVPEACSSWFLPRLVGISTAAEWCYTGRVFPAAEALERGLVRSVTRRGRPAPGRIRTRSRDRRQHRAGLGGADPPDAVAHARRRPPDGGAPGRLAWHPVARCQRRCQGGRRELSREAPARVSRSRCPTGCPTSSSTTSNPTSTDRRSCRVTFDTADLGNSSSSRWFLPMS